MERNIFRFIYTRPIKGITPVVRVGCHIKDKVYQNMNVGLFLVSLGSTLIVPFSSFVVTSMNFGIFRAKDKTVTGSM